MSRRRWLLVLALFIPIVADIGANLFSRSQFWPPLPQMWCDPIRIEQTIVPFVTGVMLGMPGGGEILLAANRKTVTPGFN